MFGGGGEYGRSRPLQRYRHPSNIDLLLAILGQEKLRLGCYARLSKGEVYRLVPASVFLKRMLENLASAGDQRERRAVQRTIRTTAVAGEEAAARSSNA